MNPAFVNGRVWRMPLGILCGLALALLLAPLGLAQETTGSIEGTVSDASGARVPSATVKIEGEGFNRTATTNSDGFYRVSQVPPGLYKVSVGAVSFSTAVAESVNVVLGKATPVDFSLKVGQVQEQVVISADDVAAIDPTDNKVQTNITSRQIEALPKGTNMTSLLKLSPATRPEPLSGQFQVDGASGSENTFIIDGQEVTNFRTGVLNLNNNLPFQFIQEIQVKTSGFEAEFGGATGGVVNVVTKSGGNEFHGVIGLELLPDSLQAGPRPFLNSFRSGTGASFIQINEYLRPDRDEFTYYYPTVGVSGPVIKDRLWFLFNYAPQIETTYRTTEYYTADPRTRQLVTTQDYKNRRRNEYFFTRLDAAPFNTLRVSGTFTWNPIIDRGVIPTFPYSFNTNLAGNISIGGAPPSTNFGGTIGTLTGAQLTNNQGGRQNANNVTAQAVWTPTSSLVASFRFSRGFLNEKLNSYFIPQATRFICTGLEPPTGAGCALGFQNIASNSQVNFDASERINYEGDLSYLINRFGGRHEFKGGYQNARVSNQVDRGYVPFGIVQLFYGVSINDRTPIEVPETPGAIGAGELIRFGTVGDASNKLQSFYVQDRWQPISRLSLNLGVRFEKEDLPSFNGFAPPINFGWGDKIAPRIGGAFDISGDGKTKIFASYGRFFDRLKFELPRGSFGGDFYRVDYFEILPSTPNYASYTLPRILGTNPDVLGGQCPIPGTTGLTKCQADFRIASNDPNADIFTGKVDPDLKPFRQTEYTVGVERELSRNFVLAARFTHKNVDWAVEDAGFPTPEGSEAYIIGNPGDGLHAEVAKQFGYAKTTRPERRYDALEVKLDRRLANNFFFNVAYTYSRLYGNYSGLASSDENGRTSPGVNRFFDLPFVGFNAAGEPDNGRLPTDRPHVFNAFGTYIFDWFGKTGFNTEFSAFTTVQSGSPLTTVFNFYGVTTILNGRGDLGRTEKYTQTDFAVNQRFKFGNSERYEVNFLFNVLNLFNNASPVSANTALNGTGINVTGGNLGFTPSDEVSAINRLLTQGILPDVTNYLNSSAAPQRRNTAVGLINNFQSGRSIRLGVRFTF